MSVTTTVKKVVTDQTYATIGATDLTVETFRGYTSRSPPCAPSWSPRRSRPASRLPRPRPRPTTPTSPSAARPS